MKLLIEIEDFFFFTITLFHFVKNKEVSSEFVIYVTRYL